MARGEFDDLPLAGRPIAGLGRPDQPDWWLQAKLRDEDTSALLPEQFALRAERDQLVARIGTFRSESDLRSAIEVLNQRIRNVNAHAGAAPQALTRPIDMAAAVEQWRSAKS